MTPFLFISTFMPSFHPRPSSWNAAIISTIMEPPALTHLHHLRTLSVIIPTLLSSHGTSLMKFSSHGSSTFCFSRAVPPDSICHVCGSVPPDGRCMDWGKIAEVFRILNKRKCFVSPWLPASLEAKRMDWLNTNISSIFSILLQERGGTAMVIYIYIYISQARGGPAGTNSEYCLYTLGPWASGGLRDGSSYQSGVPDGYCAFGKWNWKGKHYTGKCKVSWSFHRLQSRVNLTTQQIR